MKLVNEKIGDNSYNIGDMIFTRWFGFGCGLMAMCWFSLGSNHGKEYMLFGAFFTLFGLLEPSIIIEYINKRKARKEAEVITQLKTKTKKIAKKTVKRRS